MDVLAQNFESYIGMYIALVFVLPWLIFVYWVVRFHFAVKEVMGSAYSPWEAFKQSPKYAAENKEFGEVFYKRNKCFVIVILIWLVGFAGLAGLIYLANKDRSGVVNSNKSLLPTAFVAHAPSAAAEFKRYVH